MKVIRLVGLLVVIIAATLWTYVGVFKVFANPTFFPVLVIGVITWFGFIVVALHREVFE